VFELRDLEPFLARSAETRSAHAGG
jgi:hypothetical protein